MTPDETTHVEEQLRAMSDKDLDHTATWGPYGMGNSATSIEIKELAELEHMRRFPDGWYASLAKINVLMEDPRYSEWVGERLAGKNDLSFEEWSAAAA